MKINYNLLHLELIKKIHKLNLTQNQACEAIGIVRPTIFRISKGKTITLETYLILCDWLERDLDYYVIRGRRPRYVDNRLNKSFVASAGDCL